MKKIIFILIIIATIISGLYMTGKYFLLKSNKPPETYVAEIKDAVEQAEEKIELSKTDEGGKNPSESQSAAIPEKILIKVPFTSQAPFGVWDERHEEACEEASLVIFNAYLKNSKLTSEGAESEIQKMIDFEVKNYGDYKDSNAEEIIKLAKDFYGLANLKSVYDFDKSEIKKELAKGSPVIVPAAGRELGNPYFTALGPLYHNLVLVGYSGDQIITNDPGTRRGEGYRYDIDVLYSAIHDFPGDKNKIGEGRKAMIVLIPGK